MLKYRLSSNPTIPSSTSVKNLPLTSLEMDANFKSLDNDVVLKAPLNSPNLTGIPTTPTPIPDTNTTQIASTEFVIGERSNTATLTNKTLTNPTINSGTFTSPTIVTPTINSPTINSGTFSGTITNVTFTGIGDVPTAPAGTSSAQIASTQFVIGERSNTATLTNKTLTNPTINSGTIKNPSYITQGLDDAAGTITWDTDLGSNAFVSMLGNRTFALPTNMKTGGIYVLVLSTGSVAYTATWNASVKWPYDIPPDISGVNTKTVITFYYDGSVLRGSYTPGYTG